MLSAQVWAQGAWTKWYVVFVMEEKYDFYSVDPFHYVEQSFCEVCGILIYFYYFTCVFPDPSCQWGSNNYQ